MGEIASTLRETARTEPETLGKRLRDDGLFTEMDAEGTERRLAVLERDRDAIGRSTCAPRTRPPDSKPGWPRYGPNERTWPGAVSKLRQGIEALNAEGRERLLAAFE